MIVKLIQPKKEKKIVKLKKIQVLIVVKNQSQQMFQQGLNFLEMVDKLKQQQKMDIQK